MGKPADRAKGDSSKGKGKGKGKGTVEKVREPLPAPGPGQDMTPMQLQEVWLTMRPSNVLEFYGHNANMGDLAVFSNFYVQSRCPFDFHVPLELCACELSVRDRVVSCEFSEKAIMLCKAAAMGDRVVYHQICGAGNPAEAKALGRRVAGFNGEVWDQVVCSVAFEVVFQKFSKTPALSRVLLDTGERVIAEATSRDCNWGIGLDIGDLRCRDPSQWRGTNLLGWALMLTRRVLRGELHPATQTPVAGGEVAAEQSVAPPDASALSGIEKDVLKVAKKLREINRLAEQVAAGVELQPNQFAKIAGRDGLRRELASLMAQLPPGSTVAEKFQDVVGATAGGGAVPAAS